MAAHLPLLRLHASRALAWALLLGGWVGLGGLAQALAASPASAFALLALWLLALGGFATLAGRVVLPRALLAALLLAAAAGTAQALPAALHGGGLVALLPAVFATGFTVALASAAVRACRQALRVPAGPPVASAALGALLAWWGLGDITDLTALASRLALGGMAAGVLLALLLPRRIGLVGTCRAGLFDCSMPAWNGSEWRSPAARAGMVAQLAMLPMMCGLPWMVGLCRSESVSAQAVVGVHFAAMFLPAMGTLHVPSWRLATPDRCASLLVLGAFALWVLPGAVAWWGPALLHGSAWSLAWAARLQDRAARRPAPASAFAGALFNSVLVLGLGAGMALAGLQALAAWHAALGVLGALVWFGARARRHAAA